MAEILKNILPDPALKLTQFHAIAISAKVGLLLGSILTAVATIKQAVWDIGLVVAHSVTNHERINCAGSIFRGQKDFLFRTSA